MRNIKVYIDGEHALSFLASPLDSEYDTQKEARKLVQAVYGQIPSGTEISIK